MNHKTFTATIRNVAAIFISTAIAIPINGTAIAQTKDWPQKPVRLIVAFGPGGAVDTIGRDIAKELSD